MSRSKSGLFLMEMIIAICFFAVASAICVQLFIAAHAMSRQSADIQMAVMNAQAAAAAFKIVGSDTDTLANVLQGYYIGDGEVWVPFNEQWEPLEVDANMWGSAEISNGYPLNSVRIETDFVSVPAVAHIRVYNVENRLYSLSVSRYLGGE